MTNKTVCANSKTREVRAAIYCRLSKDDANEGISASIQNQEELLRGYCKEQGWNVAGVFRDDGYSGMNQNRPGFQRMLSEIEQGKFDVVLTKDLSRLGRDYADTGKLIGETFPKKRIRYIAVNDSVDTSLSFLIKWKLEKLLKRRDFGEIMRNSQSKIASKICNTVKASNVT